MAHEYIWLVQAETNGYHDEDRRIVFEYTFSSLRQAEDILKLGREKDKSEGLYNWSMRRVVANMDQEYIASDIESLYDFEN